MYVHGQVGVGVGCRCQGKRKEVKDFLQLNKKEEERRSREGLVMYRFGVTFLPVCRVGKENGGRK